MKNYKFLFDKQNGQYQGIVRAPFPENSCDVCPHFHSDFITVWDFQGSWRLVFREVFYREMASRDTLRDFEQHVITEMRGEFRAVMKQQALMLSQLQKDIARVERDFSQLCSRHNFENEMRARSLGDRIEVFRKQEEYHFTQIFETLLWHKHRLIEISEKWIFVFREHYLLKTRQLKQWIKSRLS